MSAPVHTDEQLLELVLQIIARLDQLDLDGELRVQVRLRGGHVEIYAKSARAVERES